MVEAPNIKSAPSQKYRFRVARGNAIALGRGANNKLLHPGEYLPDDYAPNKIRNLVKQGKVIPENSTMHPDFWANTPVDSPPGTDVAPLRTAGRGQTLDATEGDPFAQAPARRQETINVQSPSGIETESSEKPRVQHQQTPWNLDPSGLEGKSLDQLNVMVLERDPTMEPFETTEEAIALLSQDYKGGD